MSYKMLEPFLAKLGGSKDSNYTEEQALGIQQEALGRGISMGTQTMRYQDIIDNAGMMEGVTWTSNGY